MLRLGKSFTATATRSMIRPRYLIRVRLARLSGCDLRSWAAFLQARSLWVAASVLNDRDTEHCAVPADVSAEITQLSFRQVFNRPLISSLHRKTFREQLCFRRIADDTQRSNHALEQCHMSKASEVKKRVQTCTTSGSVNSARSVSTFSMTTSFSPHLTLAPWIPFQAPGFPFSPNQVVVFLDQLARLVASRRKVRTCEPLSATLRTVSVLSSDEGGRSSACSR